MTDLSSNRMLQGAGNLLGPKPNSQFNSIVEVIVECLPLFAASAIEGCVRNENGYNRRLARFICNIAHNKELPFFAQPESMEDETRGNSPATDIGICLMQDDVAIDPPRVALFEGKRLSNDLESRREKEYVIGHEAKGKHICCGGVERFKLSRHAHRFRHAGMIGYMENGTPDHWLERINSWISELSCQQHDPAWLDEEQLSPLTTKGLVTESSSIVCRPSSNLFLMHLWVNLAL